MREFQAQQPIAEDLHLVLIRHTMDDIPVGLFASKGVADHYAESLKFPPNDFAPEYWNTDASTPCSIAVVTLTYQPMTDDRAAGWYPQLVDVVRSLFEQPTDNSVPSLQECDGDFDD